MPRISKLAKAAQTALTDYLGVSEDETLLVLADELTREVGLALFEEGKKIADEALYIEMSQREINGQEPPPVVSEIMRNVDVVICPTSKSLTHTYARRKASKLGVRVGTMPGITKDTMVRCFSADSKKIVDLTEKVAEKLKDVKEIKVTTKAGTNITLPIKGSKVYKSTGVLQNIGESGNLPSGEVYLAPVEGESKGKIVIDGSMAGLGIVKDPIKIAVKDGMAEKITGKAQAKLLNKMLEDVGEKAFNIAEFGIGTNYAAELCGQILEDEKVLGTVHIAFGNNKSMGGTVNVPIHLDGIITEPTVFFDKKKIMDKGKLLIK